MAITGKSRLPWVKSVETSALRAYPQYTGAVGVNRLHRIVAQTCRILRDMTVVSESLVVRIEPIQTTALGPDPQRTAAVRGQRDDFVLAETRRIVGNVAVYLETVTIVTVETIFGSDPQKAPLILDNSSNGALRQALVQRDMLEAQARVGSARETAHTQNPA